MKPPPPTSAPAFLDRHRIAALLPIDECITVMERMFASLAQGDCLQPLRSLMWLPDKTGLLGMMPGYASNPEILGIKLITIFHANHGQNLPSHQGLVILFDAKQGAPLIMLDAAEITAIRTAAATAVATNLLARKNASRLAILGTGEQAKKHIESISLVRNLTDVTIWGRSPAHAETLASNIQSPHRIHVATTPQQAVQHADIICTLTASPTPVLNGDWIPEGAHINAIGSCTPSTRELDSAAVLQSRLFTDRYESLFREAGEFLIPKSEGLLSETHAIAEIGEVLTQTKPGRTDPSQITLFKSLGIAAEDLFAAHHIYDKLNTQNT